MGPVVIYTHLSLNASLRRELSTAMIASLCSKVNSDDLGTSRGSYRGLRTPLESPSISRWEYYTRGLYLPISPSV